MRRLVRLLPDPLVRFFARPYVAGDSLDDAIAVVEELRAEGIWSTLDLLAEELETEDAVARVRATFRAMVDRCARFDDGRSRPTVSLKPSSFTTAPLDRTGGRGEPVGSRDGILEIVERAAERDVGLTIDMEDRHWTQWTLDLAREIWDAGHRHVGIVLQTRLHRTRDDLDAIPVPIRVRLVIGIYPEPPEFGISDKREMKRRMVEYARILLDRGHYVEFATHDVRCIRSFLHDVVARGRVSNDRYEIQMLYGVPLRRFQRRLLAGAELAGTAVPVRLYVPFANAWRHALAYCRRRLEENPSMAMAVARNVLRVLTGRR